MMTKNYFADLEAKRALITGASSGLGACFAQILARYGVVVGLAARREERLQGLAEEINAEGGVAIPIVMDVTAPQDIKAGLDQFEQSSGGLADILINNAGIADAKSFLTADAHDVQKVFDTNQTALFSVAQEMALRWVKAERGGVIVNIASIAGVRVLGGAAAYGASKAAVAHLTQIQAGELARYGIRVNAIAPGYFETEMNSTFLHSEAGQKLIQRIPMRRTGQPEDLEGLILLLASDRSSYITGSVIPIDGGHLTTSL